MQLGISLIISREPSMAEGGDEFTLRIVSIVTLRDAGLADEPLLINMYAASREAELATFGWDDIALRGFVEMQFRARRASYELQYPGARYSIIESDGSPAGSLIFASDEYGAYLVDIFVLAEFRGRGIGRTVISDLQQRAATAGVPLSLHVAKDNASATALYEKMGFAIVSENQLQYRMEWVANKSKKEKLKSKD